MGSSSARIVRGADDLPLNWAIADKLRQMADVLEAQQANSYRVMAYRKAARSIDEMTMPIEDLIRSQGLAGADALPGIGRGIAAALVEMVTTGHWAQLDRLQGRLEPEKLFQTLPGVGPALAERIHDALHVETLEALEQAAHDGRLADVPRIGARRAQAIRAAVAQRLGTSRLRPRHTVHAPAVDLLLDVDREYRERAAAGNLPRIAPKRFNPDGEAWLPILHTKRDGWEITAMFSNTQRAHELGKTGDWVVLYVHTDNQPEVQCTVVTETRGPIEGRRVVRGREGECIAHHAVPAPASAVPTTA